MGPAQLPLTPSSVHEHLHQQTVQFSRCIGVVDLSRVRSICRVVVDCPGNITDSGMVPVYEAADIIVVPFTYDFVNVDATFRFAQTVREVSRARFIFVPNRINLNEEKGEDLEEARKQAVGLLKEYGWVTPRIKQSKVARKYRTITGLDYFQRKLVEHPLDCIVERLKQ